MSSWRADTRNDWFCVAGILWPFRLSHSLVHQHRAAGAAAAVGLRQDIRGMKGSGCGEAGPFG